MTEEESVTIGDTERDNVDGYLNYDIRLSPIKTPFHKPLSPMMHSSQVS